VTETQIREKLDQFLQELRVVMPGVQVLFAFLLILPFNQRFTELDAGERRVYFAAIILTALASALLMAPSAHHRRRAGDADLLQLLRAGTALTMAGLALLVLAMAACLHLVAVLVFNARVAAWTATLVGLFIAGLWFAAPVLYSRRDSADAG
jgi:hypothetical protein